MLVNKFNAEKEKYEDLCAQIQDKESKKLKYDFFIEKLESLTPLDKFLNLSSVTMIFGNI